MKYIEFLRCVHNNSSLRQASVFGIQMELVGIKQNVTAQIQFLSDLLLNYNFSGVPPGYRLTCDQLEEFSRWHKKVNFKDNGASAKMSKDGSQIKYCGPIIQGF